MSKSPRDEDLIIMQLAPATVALARDVEDTLDAAISISLESRTDFIRCYATIRDVYLKWGTTTIDASNFDEIIPVGQIIDLKVPIIKDTGGKERYSELSIIERQSGAAIVIIQK